MWQREIVSSAAMLHITFLATALISKCKYVFSSYVQVDLEAIVHLSEH
jgi:hypothetical protein